MNIEGEELSCAHMKSFNKEGAGSLYIYWDREWTKEYECQLVKYQTPFNALKPGDYVRCVEDQFKVKLTWEAVPKLLFVSIIFKIYLFTLCLLALTTRKFFNGQKVFADLESFAGLKSCSFIIVLQVQ